MSALMFPLSVDIDAARDGDLYIAFSQRPVSVVRIGQTADVVPDGDGPALTSAGIAPLPDGRILVPSSRAIRRRLPPDPQPLMPGAIRDNQLVLPLSTPDSWDWHAGVVDLRTGRVERLAANHRTDFQYVTRAADGTPVGMGLGNETTLWKFASGGDQD